MNENQESDSNNNNNNNNISKGISTLEENVKLAKDEKDRAESEYNQVHERVENLKAMLYDYNEKKETIPYQYDSIIALIIIISMVMTITSTSLLLGSLALIFIKSSLWLGGIISIACMPLTVFIEKKLFKKLQDFFEDKIHNNIIKSEEYQKILIQIESIEEDLDKAEDEELTQKINMRNTTADYSAAISELNLRRSMLNYYPKNDLDSKEEIQETKPYTRRRTNRYRKNTRNIN